MKRASNVEQEYYYVLKTYPADKPQKTMTFDDFGKARDAAQRMMLTVRKGRCVSYSMRPRISPDNRKHGTVVYTVWSSEAQVPVCAIVEYEA